MAEQDIAKLSLNFSTNVKDSDVDSVDRLFKVLENLDNLKIDETKIKNLSNLSRTLKGFNGVKIGANLGKGILGIVQASNQITDVKDISPHAETLNRNFQTLGQAASNFNDVTAKIPVNMGKGILGLVDATNHITKVKDISGVANRLNNNFRIISQATSYFDGMRSADYSGIARLVSAMSSINKIKPIGNTVIKNAQKLAKAVNTLTSNVTASTPRLKEISRLTNNLGTQFNRTASSGRKFNNTMTLVNLAVTIRAVRTLIMLFKKLAMSIYSTVDAWGEVENTLSFFSQALGGQSKTVANEIQGYADLGVIDFSQFANQVAKLTQIYRGYDIAAEDASKMALNFTKLAYDASYALGENGKDIELWNDRITSVATGQTRAGYRFGVDTGVKALAEEFDELSSKSDKATRSMAAYEVMLNNTTKIQNQMAREIGTTYVQMNVLKQRVTQLKQSIGYALVPAFQAIIRWGLIAIKVVEILIDSIVKFFGGEGFKIIDFSSMVQNTADSATGLSDAAEGVADGFGSANKKAKELRKTISGIDQVFTIKDIMPDSGGGVGAAVGGGGFLGGNLSEYAWDFGEEAIKNIEEINKKAEEIADNIEKAMPWVLAIAAGLASWKIAKSLLNNLEWMSKLKFAGITELSGLTLGVGFLLFISNIEKFVKYFKDFMENGPTFDNVTGMLSSFVGSLGSIFLMFGNLKWGGTLIVIQGLIDIVAGIKDMSENGINWDNVSRTLDGVGSVAIGIGVIKKNWALVGSGLILQGALRIIDEIDAVKEAIATGDWSGVDKVSLFIGVISVVGGVAIAIADFVSKMKKGKTLSNMKEAPTVTETISTSTSGVSTKLFGLAKDIAAGALVIGAAAVAAGIFVGAIWLIGELLQKVGEAWGPVLDDGENIAKAIGLGTLLLAAVGLAAWGLGTLTIASGGTIPAAIAVGTGMLLLLGGATKAFISEITSVGDKLTKELHPVLESFNEILPDLNTNMRNYTKFMLEFAGHVAAQTAGDVLSGLAGVIDTIVGFFTKDPIKKMADDVKKNYKQFDNLNDQLGETNPLISKASDLMEEYESLLKKMKQSADKAAKVGSPEAIGISFKNFSKSLRDGFDDLDEVKTSNVAAIMSALSSIDLNKFRGIGTSIVEAMELGINNYRFTFTTATNNIKLGLTFNATYLGTDIAKDVVKGINDHWFNLLVFVNKIKQGLTFSATSIGTDTARSVVSGINNYSVGVSTFTGKIRSNLQFNANSIGTTIASDVIRGINGARANTNTFNNRVKSSLNFSSNYIGNNIATGVIKGINDKYINVNTFTNNVKNAMNKRFEVRSPSRWGKRLGDNIGGSVGIGINETKLSFNDFESSVSDGLYGIMNGIDTTLAFAMPTLDTSGLTRGVSNAAQGLSAKVQGSFEEKTDGTQQAIERLASATVDRLEQLIQVTEDGKIMMVDEEVLGKTSQKYAQQQAVKNNVVFGKR